MAQNTKTNNKMDHTEALFERFNQDLPQLLKSKRDLYSVYNIYNNEVIFFHTMDEAIDFALNEYGYGKFIIQQVVPEEENCVYISRGTI